MIRRTLLEWKTIRYGVGDDCIPDWAADRIAAVARRSPLGGEGGARILSHGRKELRAGQVVGVIAAENCALEILPKIDPPNRGDGEFSQIRKQLVHMLAIALDIDVSSGAITDLGWQRENLLEILIRLFVHKLADAIHRGMPRAYIADEEDLPALRGRLNTIRQFTYLTPSSQMLACQYDTLSSDIALNQIMKAAIVRLSRVSRSAENQRRLRELAFSYAEISSVAVAALRWQAVVIDRTNARWRELVNLAKLLLGQRFQDTSTGESAGFSLLFEMNTLFEEYIAQMLRRALNGTHLSVHAQAGRLYCLEDTATAERRFMTKPDILLKRDNGIVELALDTKWKRLNSKIDDPKQGVSQSDVYQMMAYGRIYQCSKLMLLYPHHSGLDQEGIVSRHKVSNCADTLTIATLNLSGRTGILDRLRNLVTSHLAEALV